MNKPTLLQEMAHGALSSLEARKILKQNPALKKWILIPLVIDLLILIFSFGSSFFLIPEAVGYAMGFIFTTQSGFWYSLISVPLTLVFWLVFLVFAIYVTFILSTVLASPFHSILVEKYLFHVGVLKEERKTMSQYLTLTIKMIFVSLKKAILFSVLGLILFVLSFIPILNIPVAYGFFLIMSFDCLDYSFELLEMKWSERIEFIKGHRLSFMGHGLTLSLTSFIPGSTILFLPYAILGGAYIVQKSNKQGVI